MNEHFWKFRNDVGTDSAELLLYGEISQESWLGDEVTPRQFADELKTCGGKNLTVRINSGGGDVFAAQAIHTQLKNYPGKVTAEIDGICASAATIISCAADVVKMPSNALFMIHNPRTGIMGFFESKQLDKLADQLELVKQTIVNVYLSRTKNLTESQLKKKMDAETWLDAKSAKEMGFVDEIVGEIPVKNSFSDGILFVNSVMCKPQNSDGLQKILNQRSGKFMDLKEQIERIKNIVGLGGTSGEILEERERIAELDAMKNGTAAVDALIETAKKNGQTAAQIRDFVDAMPKVDAESLNMLNEIKKILQDNSASGVNNVLPSPAAGSSEDKTSQMDAIASVANRIRDR